MDINDYITERKTTIESQAQAVSNFSVFDFNYIPEKPIMREEVKAVIDSILQYRQTGIPRNLIIFGSRGSGKTLMLKYLMKIIGSEPGMCIQYVNCRERNTSFKIISRLLDRPTRGSSMSELFDGFEGKFPGKSIFILDEIDLISPKDRNREILYFLSRNPKCYMSILLSNNPRFISELDASIKSTLQPESLIFKSYDALQIADILAQRAQAGLKSHNPESVQQIAALVTREANSDVRVAIKTLLYSSINEGISIAENFENARRDIHVDFLADLNDSNILILEAARRCPDRFVKKAYDVYAELSLNRGEKSISYVHFYNSLGYLQSLGLIVLLSTKVNRAYTNRIGFLFHERILEEIFKLRFGK
jgi:cell division control protein 6